MARVLKRQRSKPKAETALGRLRAEHESAAAQRAATPTLQSWGSASAASPSTNASSTFR